MPQNLISKSRNHKIASNPNPQHPYRLMWDVPRRGATLGMPVTMHRDTDREGAEEFATRWGEALGDYQMIGVLEIVKTWFVVNKTKRFT